MQVQFTMKTHSLEITQAWRILQSIQAAVVALLRSIFAKEVLQNTSADDASVHTTITDRLRNIRLQRQRTQEVSKVRKRDFLTQMQMSGARLKHLRESNRKAKVQWLGVDQEYTPTDDLLATKALIAWYYVLSMAPPTGTAMDKLLEPNSASSKQQTFS